MKKKNVILFVSLGLTFAVAVGAVIAVDLVSNSRQSSSKSPYQLYCETHPNYTGNEEQWLQDLINGKLGDKTKYIVKFNSNGGTAISDQTVLEGEKIIEPAKPKKLGYTFKEWLYKGNPWIFYGFAVSENLTLDASWTLDSYSISYLLDGGIVDFGINPTTYDVYSDIDLYPAFKYGYVFDGWYIRNTTTKIEKISPNMTGDLTLEARYTPNKNDLVVEVSEGQENKGQVTINSGSGYSGELIDIEATAISPYAFRGWYDNNNELVSKETHYIFEMPTKDIELYAQFDEYRDLQLFVDESKGSVIGEGTHVIGELISIECLPKEEFVFKCWQDQDGNEVSKSLVYTFEMPSTNYSLTAVFMTEEEVKENLWKKAHGVLPTIDEKSNTIKYGMYPQTHVSDAILIGELEEHATIDSTGYYLYGEKENREYYTKLIASPIDLGRDSQGNKNRIYFDDGTEIVSGKEYWFKVEPVVWNILKTDNDKYLLMAKELLDTHLYHSSFEQRTDEHGNIVFANNYEYSDIRSWLTGTFYDSVFCLNDEEVLSQVVDNSPSSTNDDQNIYACENTEDNIYLPSYVDYLNKEYGFVDHESSTPERTAKTTDFARAKGSWVSLRESSKNYGYSWLRSPGSEFYFEAWRLSYGGGMNHHNDIDDKSTCVRPIISINLL